MDVTGTKYEDIKSVFQAAYHNGLFDGSIAKSGIAIRKSSRFMSRAHIQAFFDENPYVMTRVGEYIHFYIVSMYVGEDDESRYRDIGFRIKESELFDGEVEKIEWGKYHPITHLFSKEYDKLVIHYLAIFTRMAFLQVQERRAALS